jgi:hypothetical protein
LLRKPLIENNLESWRRRVYYGYTFFIENVMNIPGRKWIAGRLSKLIRIELDQDARNIDRTLQLRALQDTADYVQANMGGAKSFQNKFALLDAAMENMPSEGLLLEFGVWKGGTINHIAKKTGRTVYGFDSFEGLPEDWFHGVPQGHFKLNRLPDVEKNVKLIQGWFDQTLPSFLDSHSGPVALCHVDCDLYSSTRTVFEHLGSRIVSGTVIIFDEYFNYVGWRQGEFKAFQEFCADRGAKYEYMGYCSTAEQVAVKIVGIRPA